IAPSAMEQGLRFAIRDGGRSVGGGVVSKITEYGGAGVRPRTTWADRWFW
ncbi:MAG: hypothetical protein AAF700_11220, partial [Pseudomonadota bacterium]